MQLVYDLRVGNWMSFKKWDDLDLGLRRMHRPTGEGEDLHLTLHFAKAY